MVAQMKAPTIVDPGRAVFLYLKRLSDLRGDNLTVKSDGDIVTLEGFARSSDEKRTAEIAALEVSGVKAVANNIVVRSPAERPDTDIIRDILHQFRSNILIPVNQVKVIVSAGLVTLEGLAPSQFERMLTEAAVKRVRGVTGIRNNIVITAETAFPEMAG